jgi:LacI family transcriptional regulator
MTDERQRNAKQKATLHDVAAKVGVSPRTVSRVVNKEGGFSSATATKVLAAIAELGYRPNLLARGLITNRTNTLAFIVPVIDDPFFPEVAQGVQHAAVSRGLSMFLAVTNNDPKVENELLDRLMSQGIDGAILFPTPRAADRLGALADQGLPMVVIDDRVEHQNIACVCSDLADGVRLAVAHLKDRGRSRLAMLTNEQSEPGKRRRERTFREQTEGDDAVVLRVDPTYDGGYTGMTALLEQHPKVDGVFAYNDVIAIGALAALRDSGRSVPDDVAVIGCDDIEMSARVSPALTTIRLDRERLGLEAVDRLQAVRDSESPLDVLNLPVELIVRQST